MNDNDKDWDNPVFVDIYKALASADASRVKKYGFTKRGNAVVKWLNNNGFCNLTVCPRCHTYDFNHIEGCDMAAQLEEAPHA